MKKAIRDISLGQNDFVIRGSDNDVISTGAGQDFIISGGGNDTIDSGDDSDMVIAGAGNDIISGGGSQDFLFGDAGNDIIFGGSGMDWTYGGEGDDVIMGGAGADRIWGQLGNDRFDFNNINESNSAGRDAIFDFVQGTDLIDLSDLDAFGISNLADITITNNGTYTFIEANNVDFEIQLSGVINLNNSDFIF